MNKKVDCIIVGQGITGSLLAWRLWQSGKSFVVIDKGSDKSASAVSSGIINPITGRRFVKSWMIDELLPAAKTTYGDIARELDIGILKERSIIRRLSSIPEENFWSSRFDHEGYTQYMKEDFSGPDLNNYFRDGRRLAEVVGACQIDASNLIRAFLVWLADSDAIMDVEFVHEKLIRRTTGIEYNGIVASHIIFAEGWKVASNPFFRHLPMAPAKGEVFICHIPNLPQEYILKYKKFFVPRGDAIFWVGSTNQWEFENDRPDSVKAQELQVFLDDYLKLPYEVIDHLSGIRPSTEYRRPFIGTHPEYSNIHIMNGLGTKGFSLAPFWSKKLIDHIFHPDESSLSADHEIPEITAAPN